MHCFPSCSAKNGLTMLISDWLSRWTTLPARSLKLRRRTTGPVAAHVQWLEPRVLLTASPVGTEFRVNTFTTGAQRTVAEAPQSLATDADGEFVVTWSSDGQDGSGYGIFAQRYNAAGTASGTEFRVNAFTTGH